MVNPGCHLSVLHRVPRQGFKIRLLLHALYAGWSPVTKDTHHHRGPYQSSIRDGRLVLFKGSYLLVFGKTGATLLFQEKTFSEVAFFHYRGRFYRKNPFLLSYKNLLFSLKNPERGLFAEKDETRLPLREIHAALTNFLVQTGVPPTRQEFLELARVFVGSQARAYEAIRAGEGRFWKSIQGEKKGRGAPPIKHYPVLLSKTT